MSTSYRFRVRGRVQGVYFRQSTLQKAQALGLSGWVANRDDGSVEGMACGDDGALAAMREWLKRGPPAARVDALDWERIDEVVSDGFAVRP